MKLKVDSADPTILAELGRRLAHQRLSLGLTQAEAAAEAGVSKRTLERLEAGGAVQTTTLVRVLRQLQLLGALDALLPAAEPGPVESLRQGAMRKRAPRARKKAATKPWRWGDE